MKHLLVLFFSLFLSFSVLAQDEQTFENFAKETVAYLSDTNYHVGVEMIRINLYLDLIENQPLAKHKIEALKVEINKNFNQDYYDFNRVMGSIRKEYLGYVKEGAELEYYDYTMVPVPDRTNLYDYQVRFILSNGEMQNRVSLRFRAAYVMQKLVMVTPFSEEF